MFDINKMSLKRKLSILFFLINLGVILIVGFISYQSKKSAIKEKVENNLSVISNQLADNVDRFISERLNDVNAIALHYSLFNLETTTSSQNKVLAQYLKIYPYYDHISIINVEDIRMPTDAELAGVGYKVPWYMSAIYGESATSDMVNSPITGKPTMSFAAPISNEDGKVVSVMTANLKLEYIWDMVDQVRRQNVKSGQTGYAFMVNRKGVIIAHPKFNKILSENLMTSGEKGIRDMLFMMAKGKSGTASYTYEGVTKTAAFSPCEGFGDYKGHGWSVAVTSPFSELFSSLNPLLQLYALIFLATSLFGLAVSTLLARYIVSPILDLKRGAATIGAGNLDMRIETDRMDEVGDLAQSFNSMAEALKTRDDQIHEYTDTLTRINDELEKKQDELSRANDVLKKTNEELKKLQSQKAEFMAMVTHDIKSPLSTIITYAEMLSQGMITSEGQEYKAAIGSIHGSGTKILSLVDNFLASSTIETDRLKLSLERVDVNRFIDSEAAFFAPQMEKKRIAFEIRKVPVLPEIMADRVQLDRALSNLLSNAVKFTPNGGTITMSTDLDESGVAISVSDTGRGIAAEDLGGLFDKYKRVGGTGRHDGLGLGLFISKSIIEAHGGSITVKSELGKGSEFTIHMPRAPYKEDDTDR